MCARFCTHVYIYIYIYVYMYICICVCLYIIVIIAYVLYIFLCMYSIHNIDMQLCSDEYMHVCSRILSCSVGIILVGCWSVCCFM